MCAALVLAGVNPVGAFLQGQADYFSTLNLPHWLIQWVSEVDAPCVPVCVCPPTPSSTHPCTLRPVQGHPGNMAVVLLAMGMYGSGCESGLGSVPPRPPPLSLAPAFGLSPCPPARAPPPTARFLHMPNTPTHAYLLGCTTDRRTDLGWRIRLSEDAGEVAAAADLHPKVWWWGVWRGRGRWILVESALHPIPLQPPHSPLSGAHLPPACLPPLLLLPPCPHPPPPPPRSWRSA